jgi:hypothetical protein
MALSETVPFAMFVLPFYRRNNAPFSLLEGAGVWCAGYYDTVKTFEPFSGKQHSISRYRGNVT